MPRCGPPGGGTPTTTGTSRRGLPRAPTGRSGHRMRTGPPHRRHRPQARQRRRPPHRPATTDTPSRRIRSASPTITQEGPGHDRGTRAHQALPRQDRRAHPQLHHRVRHRDRVPRPERCRQVHDDALDHGTGPADVGHRHGQRQTPTGSTVPRCGRSGPCSTPRPCTPAAAPARTCARWPPPTTSRPPASARSSG